MGSPVAGRDRTETEGLIGFFVNTLVMRADLAGDPSFRALLGQVRGQPPWAPSPTRTFPSTGWSRSCAWSAAPPYTPLFQAVLALHAAADEELRLGGVEVQALPSETSTAKFDLSLELQDGGGALGGRIEYRADLFEEATVRRLAG